MNKILRMRSFYEIVNKILNVQTFFEILELFLKNLIKFLKREHFLQFQTIFEMFEQNKEEKEKRIKRNRKNEKCEQFLKNGNKCEIQKLF